MEGMDMVSNWPNGRRWFMTKLNWNIADWHDKDSRLLNEEYLVAVGIFSVVVLAAFIIGLV